MNKVRGKSVHVKQTSIEKPFLVQETKKFERNKRKSATLVGNSFIFREKMHGIEKTVNDNIKEENNKKEEEINKTQDFNKSKFWKS